MHLLRFVNFRLPLHKKKNSKFPKDPIIEEERFEDSIDEDCWEMIFKLIKKDDPNTFASISLVCKRFLSIASQMKTSLTVSDTTAQHLPKALRRFRHIRSICVDTYFHNDDENIVSLISLSRLQNLEALEFLYQENFPREGLRELGMGKYRLKKLKFVGVSLCDDDLILLADLFPCLEELELNCFKTYEMVTCHGVKVIASTLKKLKKVTFCDCNALTDEAIMSLSSNCKDLRGIEIQYCQQVTHNGIGFLMRNSPKLISLILVVSSEKCFSNSESQFTMTNSISYAKNLEEIQLWGMEISDDFLCSIANSCPFITKLDLDPRTSRTYNFTMWGLLALVKACSSLKSFSPRALWLTDEYMLDICEFLRGLTYINLRNCSNLTCGTFFMLTQYCPLLESVIMDDTKVGIHGNVDLFCHQNYKIKHISMTSCELINDSSLVSFVSVCPNLESLDISNCERNFTNAGIEEVLRVCHEIKHLNLSGLNISNFVGSGIEESSLKLITIQAVCTSINDEALGVIAEKCLDLEELNIQCCERVTNNGVKQMVSKCQKLKKINMYGCMGVQFDILDWMIDTRPSLEEIVSPSGFVPSEERRNLFLAKGCLLLSGGLIGRTY